MALMPLLAALAAGLTQSQPVLAELFTSQSCSSCPPAEAYFAKLAEREDLVVLEWHVDYWDRLVHGADGKWKDPFSDPAFTERQRRYNARIRGTWAVYTPQAVVAGEREGVGSRRKEVAPLLELSSTGAELSVTPAGDKIAISARAERRADVFLARFHKASNTEVRGGENKGRTLQSRNVVFGWERLGTFEDGAFDAAVEKPNPGEGCAIVVQEPGQGRVLAARYCENPRR